MSYKNLSESGLLNAIEHTDLKYPTPETNPTIDKLKLLDKSVSPRKSEYQSEYSPKRGDRGRGDRRGDRGDRGRGGRGGRGGYQQSTEQPFQKRGERSTSTVEIKSTVRKIAKMTPQELSKYTNDLQEFLWTKHIPYMTDNEQAQDLLAGSDAMKIWIRAFTHSTYDPIDNYEYYEKLGDSIISVNFFEFLGKYYPNKFDQSGLGELKNHYLSKTVLSKLSSELGLPAFLLKNIDESIHLREDVFEAFFGAIKIISENILYPAGIKENISYNMFEHVFSGIKIEEIYSRANPKTIVGQIFVRLGWGHIREYVVENDDGITYTLKFTPNAMEFLRNMNYSIKNDTLAVATGNTKLVAGKMAYVSAIDVLENTYGLTEKVVDELQMKISLLNPEIAKLHEQVLQKANSEGYSDIEVIKIKTNKEGRVTYVLRGIKEDSDGTKLENLMTIEGDPKNAREDLYKHYLYDEQ